MKVAPPLDPTHARRLELAADGAVTVRDAVAFSGVGRSELYEAMGRGELVFSQVGRRRLILRRSLTEYLAARLVVSGG